MSAPLVVIAAGGTGGHMFPAQALAEEMLARGWRVRLSTDARGARYTGGFPGDVTVETVPSATFARGGPLARLAVPGRLAAGTFAAWRAFRGDRPAVVVGFGGYPSVPAMAAATLMKLPRAIHEQNGVLGRVNRLLAPRVELVACGTWPTALPEGVTGVHVGNPVRAAVLAREGAPYIPPGDYPMHLLVLGGSQGARVLSQVVPAAVAQLPPGLLEHLRVSHQARPEDAAAVTAAYDAAGVPAEVQPFFPDVPARMAEAQLVISRAGASSLAELGVIGRPAILIPFAAAAGDHQSANAAGLAEAGAAEVLPEASARPEALSQLIREILENPSRARKMAHNALAIARPDAARALADHVEALAGKGAS